MVRLSFVITSALLLMGGVNQICAQHSGGHSSGGGHMGSSSGFHSHANYGSSGQAYHSTYTSPLSLQSGVIGIRNGALPTGPYRIGRGGLYGGNRFGARRYGAPYGYYPYFDPFLDYGNGFYFNGPDQNYGYGQGQGDSSADTANVSANLLGEQVDRLSAEVEALRNQGGQDSYAPMPRPRYNAPPLMPADETPSSAPVTLVLRDGKHLQLNSYAVMGREIWDFSTQPAKKIALTSVDLGASQKATEASGGEFPEIR